MNAKEFLEDKGVEFDSHTQGAVKVMLEEYATLRLNEYKTIEVHDKALKRPKTPKWIYPAYEMLPTKSCELLCQFKDDGRYEHVDYEYCGEDSAYLTQYVERFIYL